MPAPTAAAVTGYGGSGGAIAAAAVAGTSAGGAADEASMAVASTVLVDPRMVGAPYPPPPPRAPRGSKEPVGAPMAPEHANGLDDGELPVDTVTAVETRLQRLKRIALFSARLLAAPSASDETRETMGTVWTNTDHGRRSARLTSTTETGDNDDTAVDGGTTQGTVEGPLTWGRPQRAQRVKRRASQADR